MAVSVTSTEARDGPVTTGFWALTLGSIGVVFGDIGTSPLYAFREAVAGAAQGQPITRVIVLGVLSLILWALFIVVTAKYILLLRADNSGTGCRRFDVHRRFHDHAGDFGVVRGRGSQARYAGTRAPCGAADGLHSGPAVPHLEHSGLRLLPLWQNRLFIAMSRSANDATDYFQIPTGRVVEVGTQVTI